jgi:hypothetical protein
MVTTPREKGAEPGDESAAHVCAGRWACVGTRKQGDCRLHSRLRTLTKRATVSEVGLSTRPNSGSWVNALRVEQSLIGLSPIASSWGDPTLNAARLVRI